jgi:hypothetical protein
MPAVALSRVGARVVESGPEGENLPAGTCEDTATSRTGSGPADLATVRAAIIAALRDVGYLHIPEGRRDHTTPPKPSASTASIRTQTDIHRTRRSPAYPAGCALGEREKTALRLVPEQAWQIAIDAWGEVREKASCCQSECQREKSVSPQTLEGILLPVLGSVGNEPHPPYRYAYQPQGPTYVLSDQTLLPGRSPSLTVAPGGSKRAFMLTSGLVAQPASHDGQPVKEGLLIMAFAAVCVSNGASPEA